jgi:hypothetical protein
MEESYLKISHPSIAAISVKDCGERVLSLLDLPRVFLPSQILPPLPFGDKKHLFARQGVHERLEIAINLLPGNIGMLLLAAYRPYESQKKLFDRKA